MSMTDSATTWNAVSSDQRVRDARQALDNFNASEAGLQITAAIDDVSRFSNLTNEVLDRFEAHLLNYQHTRAVVRRELTGVKLSDVDGTVAAS